MSDPAYDTLDDALEVLGDLDALGNHGPMAAEALCALGRGEAAVGWMERYRRRFKPLKPRGPITYSISREDWRESLGKADRVEAWSVFFLQELEEAPWPTVLDRWVSRLAPGFSAVALHGPIRTGHAARALAARDTPRRRKELADGLAHWAAGYATLPTGRSAGPPAPPSCAIRAVELLPVDQRPAASNIVQAISALDGFAPFEPVIAAVDLSGSDDDFLSDLTGTFAAAYLANDVDFLSIFGFIHAVTGPAALRMIAPHVSSATLRASLSYAWQASAAIYARFGRSAPIEIEPVERFDREGLIDRAVASDDEHAIKFTETCLREHALHPHAAYLTAAPRAVTYLAARATR